MLGLARFQSEENKNDTNNLSDEDIKKLESFTYKNTPKRAICIGNNVGGVFCVEDAVQSTNEIAASAIGFADDAKVLSVTQWEKEYEEIDNTFSEDGTIGEPSYPSVDDGHLEGGMGTVSTGEPDKAPVSTKTENLPLSLNGHYTGRTSSCNCQLRGTEKENPCSYQLNYPFSFNVSNNVIQWLETDFVGTITNINSSGDASYSVTDDGYRSNFTFHFYNVGNSKIAFNGTGSSSNYYRVAGVPDLNIYRNI